MNSTPSASLVSASNVPRRRLEPLARGRRRRLLGAALGLLGLFACEEERAGPPRSAPGYSDAGVVSHLPVTEHLVKGVKRAAAAAARLDESVRIGRPSRRDYLALRQELAALRPFLRLWGEPGARLLLGGAEAAAGEEAALRALDGSLARNAGGSVAAARKQAERMVTLIRRIDNELVVRPLAPAVAAQALSDGAFELGVVLMEADALAAEEPDAVLADWRGMLAGVADGARVLGRLKGETADVAAALRALLAACEALEAGFGDIGQAEQRTGRAELVAMTARLGVTARLFAQALGVRPSLPYRVLRPLSHNDLREPVSALVLPEVPTDPGRVDAAALGEAGAALFRELGCGSCHEPAHAFAQATAVPGRAIPKAPPRNTPTLLYAAYAPAQGWDGGLGPLSLEHAVATSTAAAADLLAQVAAKKELAARLAAIFPGGLTQAHLARALGAHLGRALVPAEAPIDRLARGESTALSPQASAGFDVFVGKGRCARCHAPPLFGGVRPPRFDAVAFAVTGVPARPDGAVDPDPGRERVSGKAADRHAFRVPSLRNVARTAPYFHHGAFASLAEVLVFYQRGGGSTAGEERGGVHPVLRTLSLTPAELDALEVFLREALGDPG